MVVQLFLKSAVLVFLCWILTHPVTAQGRFLEHSNYTDLLERAKQENKSLFLIIHQQDEHQFIPFKGSVSKKAKEMLDTQFIAGIVQLNRDDFNHPLHQTFYLNKPIYLFTDKDGIPLLRHNKAVDGAAELEALIDSASTLAKGETLGKLSAQYHKGMRQQSLLKKMLDHYQAFDQYTDQQVLSDYIAQLTVQELNNFETVIFLLSCGPVYNSKTYLLARTNGKMVDSLYSTLPLPRRKKINNRIIQQTFREALNKKDLSLAHNVGYFAYQTWMPNYLRGAISQGFYPLEYKRLTRDTVAYVEMARSFYNDRFYRISPDSMSRIDFAQDRQAKFSRRGPVLDSAQHAAFKQSVEKGRPYYLEDQSRNLSYGAQQLLVFAKNNPEALFDAIRWQKKAIDQRPGVAQYHATLAQLLYQVGFYAQAEAEQQQAVTLARSNKRRHQEMQTVLKQIRARLL
ncbi:hypothetical protein ACK8HY_09695 [Sphingobacterium sp. NGMCC 1.201703]|uniref:hypothetical protein n=1 Tax=Sphingobacterium sp. NGMCC 1.201703 TaxID=3388657 RepID=UPI0039FB9D05